MGGSDGGAGGPLVFNAGSCYTQTAVNPPAPPTNVKATSQ